MRNFTFNKGERLRRKDAISDLFLKGFHFKNDCLKVFWNFNHAEKEADCKICISIPKKKFKKAVTRNLIRRRIREAYRLNKHSLINQLKLSELKIDVMIVYQRDDILEYKEIEEKIILTLLRLSKELKNKNKTDEI